MIHYGFEMNYASAIIGQELQVDNVAHKQTNTLWKAVQRVLESR
jgi:hypothetical protein